MSAAEKLNQPYEIVCDTDDEPAWLTSRFSGIGASEIGAVIGVDPRRSQLSLFLEKTGAIQPDDLSEVEAIKWGHLLEPVIANEFSRMTGRKVRRASSRRYTVLRSKEHPWATASLDFWTSDGTDEWPLEIKNVNAYLGEDWLNGTPEYYVAQLTQQMIVTGTVRGTSCCLLGGNRLLWCDVDRDETLVRKITFNGSVFWERIVQKNPPDPDSSEATTRALKKLYPVDNGEGVSLPAALESIIYEWRRLKDEGKDNEKRVKLLENQIKATMGEAQRGIIVSTGDSVSWKTQHVREHVVKAGTKRPLLFHESKRR
jgi:putative phage-type endonuclease